VGAVLAISEADNGAVDAFVFVVIGAICLALGIALLAAPRPSATPAIEEADSRPPIRAPLTADQHEFRVALKQFSLTCVPDLTNRANRVFTELKTKEKELSAGSPSSVALHFFIHLAYSSGLNMQYASQIQGLAGIDVEFIDVTALQIALKGFLYGDRRSRACSSLPKRATSPGRSVNAPRAALASTTSPTCSFSSM
jgi:hypothetical protein